MLNIIENEINKGNLSGKQITAVGRDVLQIKELTSERVQRIAERIENKIERDSRNDSGTTRVSGLGVDSQLTSTPAQATPTQTSTQEKKDFTPEYQLDRSKIEADSRYDKLRSEMSSRTIEMRAKHIAHLFSEKVGEMVV